MDQPPKASLVLRWYNKVYYYVTSFLQDRTRAKDNRTARCEQGSGVEERVRDQAESSRKIGARKGRGGGVIG